MSYLFQLVTHYCPLKKQINTTMEIHGQQLCKMRHVENWPIQMNRFVTSLTMIHGHVLRRKPCRWTSPHAPNSEELRVPVTNGCANTLKYVRLPTQIFHVTVTITAQLWKMESWTAQRTMTTFSPRIVHQAYSIAKFTIPMTYRYR